MRNPVNDPDNVNDSAALQFLQLLDMFNLKQHVTGPTHKNGHTLDLFITRTDENIAQDFSVFDPVISDHLAVCCTLALEKTPYPKKVIYYRKLKSIEMSRLRADIIQSPITSVDDSTNVLTLVDQYNAVFCHPCWRNMLH